MYKFWCSVHLLNYRCLQKLMGDGDNNWDQYNEPILFAIQTSVQDSTKHTPFFLMYGREAKLPLEVEKLLFLLIQTSYPVLMITSGQQTISG